MSATKEQLRVIKDLLNHPTISYKERNAKLAVLTKLDFDDAAFQIGMLMTITNERQEQIDNINLSYC